MSEIEPKNYIIFAGQKVLIEDIHSITTTKNIISDLVLKTKGFFTGVILKESELLYTGLTLRHRFRELQQQIDDYWIDKGAKL